MESEADIESLLQGMRGAGRRDRETSSPSRVEDEGQLTKGLQIRQRRG